MYTSLEEKSYVFKQHIVNTPEELHLVISEIGQNADMRFRGVNESKYTMLTSLQRHHPNLNKQEQIAYVSELLAAVKGNHKVVEYFKDKKIPQNDLTCMALMQHYGLPTPLLDFSTDIKIALSFAAGNINTTSENYKTDKYVSLYVIDLASEKEVSQSIQKMYKVGMEAGEYMYSEHKRQYPEEQIDASELYDIGKFIKWDDLKGVELAFIEYQPFSPVVTDLSGNSLKITNPNLLHQKGCFVLNTFNATMPMEENWNMRTKKCRNKYISTNVDFSTFPFSGVYTNEQMTCYDINKDVIKTWAKKESVLLYVESKDNIALYDELSGILKSFH